MPTPGTCIEERTSYAKHSIATLGFSDILKSNKNITQIKLKHRNYSVYFGFPTVQAVKKTPR